MGNNPPLGLDVASVHGYWEALQQAHDRAAGRHAQLTLEDEPGRQFVLLVFLPIYGPALQHLTVEERHKNLRAI